MIAAHFDVGRVQPQIRPLALDRPRQESLDAFVDLAAEPRDLALADALHAHGTHEIIDRAGRDPVHVGLLDYRRQRLFGGASRLEKTWEVAAASQLWDAQLNGACPGLPVAVTVAIALVAPLLRALAVTGAAQLLGLKLHQTVGGKADHLAQEHRVWALLQQRAKRDRVVGHRGGPQVRVACGNPTLPKNTAVAAAVGK